MVLPEASCAECEARISWFEQYCLKQTFGPIRYHLKMKTKRPSKRPKTLPLELEIGGQWVKREVPVEHVAVSILFPLFDPPEILACGVPTRTNIYTKNFLMRGVANGDLSKINELFGATQGRSYRAVLAGDRFALLLAKIAHGCVMAESRNLQGFNPVLQSTILRRPDAPPLPYLIGGMPELEPVSTRTHEMKLLNCDHPVLGMVWLVQIRLFGWLNSPTYQVVAGVECPPIPIANNT